jgi:hypothetical protein
MSSDQWNAQKEWEDETIVYHNPREELLAKGGHKDDADKVRVELIPPEFIFAVATILTSGAVKYAARNWEHGMSWGRVFGALMRHLWAWWGGKAPTTKSFLFGPLDSETGHSHLWHAGCCLAFLIAYEERGDGTDDRWMGTRERTND